MVFYVILYIFRADCNGCMKKSVHCNTQWVVPTTEQCIFVIRSYECIRCVQSPICSRLTDNVKHIRRSVKRKFKIVYECTDIHPYVICTLNSCRTFKFNSVTFKCVTPVVAAANTLYIYVICAQWKLGVKSFFTAVCLEHFFLIYIHNSFTLCIKSKLVCCVVNIVSKYLCVTYGILTVRCTEHTSQLTFFHFVVRPIYYRIKLFVKILFAHTDFKFRYIIVRNKFRKHKALLTVTFLCRHKCVHIPLTDPCTELTAEARLCLFELNSDVVPTFFNVHKYTR